MGIVQAYINSATRANNQQAGEEFVSSLVGGQLNSLTAGRKKLFLWG